MAIVPGSVLAFAGGVGGAKLAWGLAQALAPDTLVVVVNTGDDAEFHGLHVSPDLDTVMYTLAGIANEDTGWGIEGESFNSLEMLKRYDAPAWFGLGDRDLATHIERSRLLRQGISLSDVTDRLRRLLGVTAAIVPMSDQRVQTKVLTREGELAFQDYFVRLRCEPWVQAFRFEGIESAEISPGFRTALKSCSSVVFCPSNPFVSIGPILSLSGVKEALSTFSGPRIAVSPIVGGQALRGPADKMFRELGEEASCVGVARRLIGLCDIFVIDIRDADRAGEVLSLGMDVKVMDTVMSSSEDKVRLAGQVLSTLGEVEGK